MVEKRSLTLMTAAAPHVTPFTPPIWPDEELKPMLNPEFMTQQALEIAQKTAKV